MPLGDIPMPTPPEARFGGTLEIILEGLWRAVYVHDEPLPEEIPAVSGYALVVKGEYGYVTERDDSEGEGWMIVEGEIADGETPEAFVTRAAHAQTGASVSQTIYSGYLDCEATSFNTKYETGEHTVRPIYVAIASAVGPVPDESGYHRRRLPMNQFQTALRLRYPELWKHLSRGLDRYLILQRTGKISS